MKARLLSLFIVVILSGISTLFAQGFKAPAEGKAVVYFARVSNYGFKISFEYFHENKYIGAFKGENYLRYECNPGENLFWASSENKEFITGDLKAGGTYIVVVDIIMGAWKARVGFDTLTVNNKELFERAKKLINEKAPSVTSDEKIQEMNKKLEGFIAEKLQLYNDQWKTEKNFKRITSDMAIPLVDMQ
jgi:hypothetical protein